MNTFLKNISNNNLSDYKNPDLIRAFHDHFCDDFIHNNDRGGFLFGDPNTDYNLYILYSIFSRLPTNSGIKETKFKHSCLKEEVYEEFCKTVLLKNGWKEDYEIPLFFHYYYKKGYFSSSKIKSFIFITNEFIYALSEKKSSILKIPSEIFFKNLRVKKSFGGYVDYYNDERTYASIEEALGSFYKNNTPEFLENISKSYHSYISFQSDASWTKVDWGYIYEN